MKKSIFRIQVLLVLCMLAANAIYAQVKISVSGNVTDEKTNEQLVGASIVVKDKLIGTTADINGHYRLEFNADKDQALLSISMVGYETKIIAVSSAQPVVNVSLKLNMVMAKEVVVTASRVPETILEAPVTVIKMNALDVKETPKENYYSGLANSKGIDIITGGLIYQILNTRGFNDITNSRVVQLIDGIDNSAPGLGRPFSNLLGTPDVDVERVEVVPGAASALYGANAFNGLINIITKDPFTYPGLSVQVKGGANHVDGKYHNASLYNDLQLRYAKVIGKKFGFKITGAYTRGTDWTVTDSSDLAPTGGYDGFKNPGRNANNIYGDEVAGALPLGPNYEPVVISRTGYNRSDLVDDITYSFKTASTLSYKFSDRLQLSYTLQYGQGATSYDAYDLKNVWQLSHKLELKGNNFFVRSYYTHDEGGDAYNAMLSIIKFNESWKSSGQWFGDYYAAFKGYIPGVTPNDFDAARAFADIGKPVVGSETFNHSWDSIISLPIGQVDANGNGSGGGRFKDQSSRIHTEAQYDFSKLVKVADMIAGGNIRSNIFNSNGTVLIDKPGEPININEYAAYIQATKELFKKHLKVIGSIRYDASDNFKGEFTPRAAVVFKPDDKNFIRASYQSGFRLPDPLYQYQNIDLGYARLIGFLPAVDNIYHVKDLTFTKESVDEYKSAFDAYLMNPANNGDTAAAVDLYKEMLKKEPWGYIRPEHVKTFEIGYQRLFLNNVLYIDVNYFHNLYEDMQVSENVIKTKNGNPQSEESITEAGWSIAENSQMNPTLSQYSIGVNSFNTASCDGIETGVSIVLPKNYLVSTNFTYIQSNVTSEKDIPGFCTPKYKCNIGLSNRNIVKNLGFAINWRWVDAISSWNNTPSNVVAVNNSLPAHSTLDLQLNYRIKKTGTTIKMGTSNLTNNYYQDYAGGASVGGLYYLSIVYDGIFN
ncbi:MAG: TonB-dependent receptor [Bacteroidia bacterium]